MLKWIRLLFILLFFFLSACGMEAKDVSHNEDSQDAPPKAPSQPPIVDGGYENSGPELASERITYVGKISNITDFTGFGQHLFYFPAFNLNAPDDYHRTDDDAAYFSGDFKEFEHHQLLSLNSRTFSPDAGGSPLGVKARGGYSDWPIFILPDGQMGLSGTIYDDATRGNSNNTFNQIKLNKSSPSHFCLNIILDNSNLENIPDTKLVARSDNGRDDLSLEGHPDFKFDGRPDMYTFRYVNMSKDGKIKIKLGTSKEGIPVSGAGVAGVMISNYETCAPAVLRAER